jgi:hypothetical protein
VRSNETIAADLGDSNVFVALASAMGLRDVCKLAEAPISPSMRRSRASVS